MKAGIFIITALVAFFPYIASAESKDEVAGASNEEFRQELGSIITEGKEGEEVPNELDSFVRRMPSRGVAAMPGRVAITEASSEYNYDLKAFGKLPVEFSLSTQYVGIENTTRVTLPAHLTGLIWGVETTLPFFDFNKTYLRMGVYPSFYTGNWSFDSSSFRIPFRSFLIYQPSDKWAYILGVAVYPDFEDKVYPIIGFIYKPNDKWAFNIIPERPNITYAVNDKISLFTEFDASWREFEVTRDNQENVVLAYKEEHLGAGVLYKFNKYIQSSVSIGGTFGRSLKYRDGEGKVSIKDGLYTEFRVNIQI